MIKLGQLIKGEATRDAIHIAVAPVVAAETLAPGYHVGLNHKGEATAWGDEKRIGIVDPYLTASVKRGQMFYLFLYPNTVTSMHHEWQHPAFPATALVTEAKDEEAPDRAVQDAENWLKEWIAGCGLDYEETMGHARDYVVNGGYWSEGGRFEGWDVPDEFWDHYQIATGTVVLTANRGSFFSCAC